VYEHELPNIIKSKDLLPKLSSEAQETMQVLRDAQKEYNKAEETTRYTLPFVCCLALHHAS
jgi:hypothetical protein